MLTGTAQALSPLKKFEPDGVPVAERSTLPTVTEPVALVFVVLKLTNVPFELSLLVSHFYFPSSEVRTRVLVNLKNAHRQ